MVLQVTFAPAIEVPAAPIDLINSSLDAMCFKEAGPILRTFFRQRHHQFSSFMKAVGKFEQFQLTQACLRQCNKI